MSLIPTILIVAFGALACANGAVVFLDTYQGNYVPSGTAFGDNAPGNGLPETQNLSIAVQFVASERVSNISVTLAVADFYGTSGLPLLGIYGNAQGGGPGASLLEQMAESSNLPLSFDQPLILNMDVELNAGQSYWLVLSADDGDKFSWMVSEEEGPPIWVSTNGGTWSPTAVTAGQLKIEGEPTTSIPEPSAALLGVIGTLSLLRRRRLS